MESEAIDVFSGWLMKDFAYWPQMLDSSPYISNSQLLAR